MRHCCFCHHEVHLVGGQWLGGRGAHGRRFGGSCGKTRSSRRWGHASRAPQGMERGGSQGPGGSTGVHSGTNGPRQGHGRAEGEDN